MNHEFSGEIAYVSGAGRGFGRAVAERLASGGAKLVITDISDALVGGTLDALRASGAEAEGIAGDQLQRRLLLAGHI